MNTYIAYNLCIHSELCLPELIATASDGPPDVVIQLGKIASSSLGADRGNHFVGKVEAVGRFLVQDGRQIIVEPLPRVDEGKLRATLLGPILSALLRQRGLLVLHASSIAINNGAVAFMGGSGWGKSTLAGAFHAKGCSALTDDVMAVNTSTGYPTVLPGFPQFKLFPEAATSIGHDPRNLSPICPDEEKLSYKFRDGFQQAPLPLQRIYVLAKGTQHAIDRLQPQAAFAELVRHSRAVTLLNSPDFVNSHFCQCSHLLRFVPVRRFTRKPSLQELPELVKIVEEDLAHSSDCTSDIKYANISSNSSLYIS